MDKISELHNRAMQLAEEALVARARRHDRADKLLRIAFNYERRAWERAEEKHLDEPSRSILARSAAALARDCHDPRAGVDIIDRTLARQDIPLHLREQLVDLRGEFFAPFRIACSPDKLGLLQQFCDIVNDLCLEDEEGRFITTQLSPVLLHEFPEFLRQNEIQAISPESTYALRVLRPLLHSRGLETHITSYFCSSPVVIALRPELARTLEDSAGHELTFRNIMEYAARHPEFTWIRPHDSTPVGAVAAYSELRAFFETTDDISLSDERADTIRHFETRVRRFAPSDVEVVEQTITQHGMSVDAVVAQEHVLVRHIASLPESERPVLVALQPTEAVLDHPFVFTDDSATAQTVSATLSALWSSGLGDEVLASGGISPYDPEDSNLVPVSPETLEAAVRSFQEFRKVVVVLMVCDVSASMRGEKLQEAKAGMQALIGQLRAEQGDMAGLLAFSDEVDEVVQLASLVENRDELNNALVQLKVKGNTALYSAVARAIDELSRFGARNLIRAVVLLSDGRENASGHDGRDRALQLIREVMSSERPVLIFALAYGKDADASELRSLTDRTSGVTLEGNPANVRALYDEIAKYL